MEKLSFLELEKKCKEEMKDMIKDYTIQDIESLTYYIRDFINNNGDKIVLAYIMRYGAFRDLKVDNIFNCFENDIIKDLQEYIYQFGINE